MNNGEGQAQPQPQPQQGQEDQQGQAQGQLVQQQPIIAQQQQQPAFPAMAENMLTLAFKPPVFNGQAPETAGRWLRNFNRHADLADIEGQQRCTLLGLLLSDNSETWFNSLPQATRQDYDQLQKAFRQMYMDAQHNRWQKQMATLTTTQQSGESVDVYITNARAKMADQQYDEELQMSLLLNGLRPEIKSLVLQHQPLPDLQSFVTKCKTLEASLQASLFNHYIGNATYPMVANLASSAVVVNPHNLKKVDEAIDTLVSKINNLELQADEENHRREQGEPCTDHVLRCYNCGSTKHLVRGCPHNASGSSYRSQDKTTGRPPSYQHWDNRQRNYYQERPSRRDGSRQDSFYEENYHDDSSEEDDSMNLPPWRERRSQFQSPSPRMRDDKRFGSPGNRQRRVTWEDRRYTPSQWSDRGGQPPPRHPTHTIE